MPCWGHARALESEPGRGLEKIAPHRKNALVPAALERRRECIRVSEGDLNPMHTAFVLDAELSLDAA